MIKKQGVKKIPVASTVDLMVPWIDQKWPTSNSNGSVKPYK